MKPTLSIILFFAGFLIWNTNLLAQGFLDMSSSAGITFQHDGEDPTIIDHYDIGTGAAWFDYNNDGWIDLYLTKRRGANQLYHNNGNGTFTDVAAMLGATDSLGDGSGVVIGDFNNDGWQDIYLANNMEDRLLKNINGTHFQDITLSAGLTITSTSKGTTASWGDYDNDGFLDLYIAHHRKMQDTMTTGTTQDFLFHNNGDETFTDVSSLLGTAHLVGFGFIGGWTDFDNDGDLDIILVNDCFANTLPIGTKVFRNDGGASPTNWIFTEVSVNAGINDCRNGMGLAVGDFNRDGWQDIYYSSIGPSVLFKNNVGKFTDVTPVAGVGLQDSFYYFWGPNFFDVDMDGWLDILLMSGSLQSDAMTQPRPNELYLSDGNGETFTNVSNLMNMNHPGKARSSVFADYDQDGDLDLFIVNYGETGMLMENINFNGKNYVQFNLTGTVSNKDGIGAKIKITTPDGLSQYHEVRSGSNLGGGDMIDAFFGVDTNTMITNVEITWPSGFVQTGANIPVNRTHKVTESSTPVGTATVINTMPSSLLVYPNPVTNATFQVVCYSEDPTFRLEIFNAFGQQIYDNQINSNPYDKTIVDISTTDFHAKSGAYFVRMQDSKGQITKQVMIIE